MDIAWAFNGELISAESTDQFSITKGKRLSVLSIDAVAARHAGEYTCTASNKAGASSHTAALAVNGNTARMYTRAYTRRLDYSSSAGRRQNRPSLIITPFNLCTRAITIFSTFPCVSSSTGSTMRTRLSVVWPYRDNCKGFRLAVLSHYINSKQWHCNYSLTEFDYLFIFM